MNEFYQEKLHNHFREFKGNLAVFFFFIDSQTKVGIQSLKPLHKDPINTLIQEYFKYIKKPTDNYRDLSTRSWHINISFPEKGRGNQQLVLLLFLTFRVVRNPSREFWIATTLKLLRNLFRLWVIFLPNLRILSRKNNKPTIFILFRGMTMITSISDRPNVSLVHVSKSIKKRSSFAKKKIQLYWSTPA